MIEIENAKVITGAWKIFSCFYPRFKFRGLQTHKIGNDGYLNVKNGVTLKNKSFRELRLSFNYFFKSIVGSNISIESSPNDSEIILHDSICYYELALVNRIRNPQRAILHLLLTNCTSVSVATVYMNLSFDPYHLPLDITLFTN